MSRDRRVVDDVARAEFVFLRAIARGYVDIPADGVGCWNWLAAKRPTGYGMIGWRSARCASAHAVAFAALRGELVNAPLVIDHMCRNTSCVNPDHLRAVTERVNILASENPAARQARRSACPKGHELADANLTQSGRRRGRRNCAACDRAASREQHRAIRAAAAALGMRQKDYTAAYGYSRDVALAVVREVAA